LGALLSSVASAWMSAFVFAVDPKFEHAREALFRAGLYFAGLQVLIVASASLAYAYLGRGETPALVVLSAGGLAYPWFFYMFGLFALPLPFAFVALAVAGERQRGAVA